MKKSHDSKSQPPHHADSSSTSFQNPWSAKSLFDSKGVLSQFPLALEKKIEEYNIPKTKVVNPDFGEHSPNKGSIKATWLGHAGFLVQLPSVENHKPIRIMFDPIWSERASPNQLTGPRRRLPPPCALEDLPDFQYVVTSHNHYDHLDWPTIEQIFKLKGERVHFLAPLGNETWFSGCGIPKDQITQLDWYDTIELRASGDHPEVKFTCVPAQHSSGRGILDQRTTLWGSWVVQQIAPGARASVYHAGDTGYMTQDGPCPAFADIGRNYGPFDLSMIPIWRGGSLSWIASLGLRLVSTELLDGLHASPAHAVKIHKDVKSKHSIGMHFATFAGSDGEAREPVAELMAAKEQEGVGDWQEDEGFGVVDIGETAVIPISDDSR